MGTITGILEKMEYLGHMVNFKTRKQSYRSKKKLEKDGSQNYEKHKIFLYKEDFDKFAEGLDNAVAYIKAALNGETMAVQEEVETNKFDDIDFDDLSK